MIASDAADGGARHRHRDRRRRGRADARAASSSASGDGRRGCRRSPASLRRRCSPRSRRRRRPRAAGSASADRGRDRPRHVHRPAGRDRDRAGARPGPGLAVAPRRLAGRARARDRRSRPAPPPAWRDRRPPRAGLRGALRAGGRASSGTPFVAGARGARPSALAAAGRRRWRRATARYDFGSSSRPRAWRSSPTRTRRTGWRRGTFARWPRRSSPGPPEAVDADLPETDPTRRFGVSSEIATPRPGSRRPRWACAGSSTATCRRCWRSSAARSRRRGRWRCSCSSSRSRPGSASGSPRRRGARRLPGLLALRRRLAPDEHRGRPGAPPAGIATELIERAVRGGGRGRPVHARGPDLEPRGDRDVRAASASAPPATAAATTTTTARTP